ncbi:MAG TPA: AAA family ATPase [Candidatus Saccharimonadales bacterium]
MQAYRLVGLSGTNGAGKDSVGLLLAQKHRFLFISVTDILREELRNRGVPVDRLHLRELSAEWRREFGLAVLVDRAVKQYEAVQDTYDGLVLASLRNPSEADRVHELGGTMVWVDADPKVRYERIRANAQARNRGGEDDVTFEQFLEQEEAEMHPPKTGADEATLDMASVKERCDLTLFNNSSSLDALDDGMSKLLKIA